MLIYKRGSNNNLDKYYYPIMGVGFINKRGDKLYYHVSEIINIENQHTIVYDNLILDGFEVKHIGFKSIDGVDYMHDFELIIGVEFCVEFITPYRFEYKIISEKYKSILTTIGLDNTKRC